MDFLSILSWCYRVVFGGVFLVLIFKIYRQVFQTGNICRVRGQIIFSYEDQLHTVFGKASLVFGRDGSCDVVIPSPTMSKAHFQVERTKKGYSIQDLSSANGTWVNGKSIQRALLHHEDRIQAGNVEFLYVEVPYESA